VNPADDLPRINLHPGDRYATKENVMLTTLLGSCVSACLYDPVAHVAGMNHFLLANRRYARDLPLTDTVIETPLATMHSAKIADKKLVFVPMLRAGTTFVDGMMDLVPTARVAHIGLYREPHSFAAVEYFFKSPSDLGERLAQLPRRVVVTDPAVISSTIAIPASTSSPSVQSSMW